jgi:hypothetical protein
MILWILFAAVALLQILDVITTIRAFKRGAKEANKIMAWLMGKIGVVPALIATKTAFIAVLLVAIIYAPSSFLGAVLAATCGFYAWIVYRNHKLG